MFKGLVDKAMAKRKFNAAQTARATNVGILLAAGLIAGEGLMGLFSAAWKFFFLNDIIHFDIPAIFKNGKYFGVVDLYIGGLAVARPDRALPDQGTAQERRRRGRTAAAFGRHLRSLGGCPRRRPGWGAPLFFPGRFRA